MCGKAKAPKVTPRDPLAEQEEAARKATLAANAELAYRRSKRQSSSLIANVGGARGAGPMPSMGSIISQPTGKSTLG